MVAECGEFLREQEGRNKGNGYRLGHTYGHGRRLEFRIPRDRFGNFHPKILAILRDQEARHNRMSRHLYDLERLMDTPYGREAIADHDLYNAIVEHRKTYYNLKYVDYSIHAPEKIDFIPPLSEIEYWKADYNEMQRHFIFGPALSFDDLMKRMEELRNRFRSLSKPT